jgi:hypothetical protein
MMGLFETTAVQLSESVDRRKAAARAIKSKVEELKEFEKHVTGHRKKLEESLAKLKAMTKTIVEANPDIPFKDKLGKKLSIAKNGRPSVKYDFELTHKSVRNIMLEPLADLEEHYAEYVLTEVIHTLDTGRVLADLQAGKELPWAKLVHGTNLRGL